jgi:predicted nucleic acid-binding protein
VTVTRKLGRPMHPEDALSAVERLQTFPVAVVSNAVVLKGIRRSIHSKISFWDALIVETALAEGVSVLVTEDLHDDWKIGPMRIWNPFKV